MKVQTLLSKQAANEPKSYEIVTCPACTQFHFINKATVRRWETPNRP